MIRIDDISTEEKIVVQTRKSYFFTHDIDNHKDINVQLNKHQEKTSVENNETRRQANCKHNRGGTMNLNPYLTNII